MIYDLTWCYRKDICDLTWGGLFDCLLSAVGLRILCILLYDHLFPLFSGELCVDRFALREEEGERNSMFYKNAGTTPTLGAFLLCMGAVFEGSIFDSLDGSGAHSAAFPYLDSFTTATHLDSALYSPPALWQLSKPTNRCVSRRLHQGGLWLA